MTPDQEGRDSPKPPADAFGDLCKIGTNSTDKSPKQLFAEKNATPKKPINQLINQSNPQMVQASSHDLFGTIDTSSLPDAANFKTTSHDPFDTSCINNPLKAMQNAPLPACNSNKPSQLPVSKFDGESDSDNFDLPSPEGPPPPLPPERKIDKINNKPPPPPPRPNSTPATSSQRQLSCDDPHALQLPPRNIPPESQKTSIKPVPRRRPQSKGLSGHILKESHSSPSNLGENTQSKSEENNNLKSSPSNEDKLSLTSSHSSNSSSRFVVEDPFENNDPFADCDPFNSSEGFSSVFDNSGNDPFAMTFTSQNKGQQNGHFYTAKDPFADFDNSISDPFSFKSNGVQKSIKSKVSICTVILKSVVSILYHYL
jgi:hypothetical protein